MLNEQKVAVTSYLKQEEDVIIQEVDEILSKVFELGEGDLAVGVVRSLKQVCWIYPLLPPAIHRGRSCLCVIRRRHQVSQYRQSTIFQRNKGISPLKDRRTGALGEKGTGIPHGDR